MAQPTKPTAKTGAGRLVKFRSNQKVSAEYYFADIDATLLRDVIDAVTRHEAAIMFSRTSDGGAYSVLVLDGQDKAREYPHGPEELTDVLRALLETYSD
jgi:hypothetical protein